MLTVALRRQSDVFLPFVFVTTIATGLALAARINPALATLRATPRIPNAREWLSIGVGLAVAYFGFCILDEVVGVLTVMSRDDLRSARGRANLTDDLLAPLWLLLAVLPAALGFLRRGSLQQGLLGTAASLPIGLAMFLAWQSVGKPWAGYSLTEEVAVTFLALVPIVGLLLGAGIPAWWRSLSGSASRRDFALPALVAMARLLWLGQAALIVAGLILMTAGVWHRLNDGMLLGGIALVALAVVWIRALGRLDRSAAPGFVQTAIAILLLVILFGVSQLPAIWIT